MSNPRPVDQTRYCERCGISFLWSAEEQSEMRAQTQGTVPPPSHCPACRLLLPAAGRERGLVKWYNHRKRYGFLVRQEHPEIFAHGADLLDAASLRPGDLVEFRVEQGERGPAAKEITILSKSAVPMTE